MTRRRVAVLGAGIMGTATAIELARRGLDVTLIDREPAPMSATSRWNEGKIHLGFLYGADPTTATAEHILPGSLVFGDRARELIGSELDGHVTREDDVYLLHRDSVVDAATMRRKFDAIGELVRRHPDAARYLVDVSDARVTELGAEELAAIAGDGIVAGFRVPERSVDTRWFADRLAAAVADEPRVTLRARTTVVGAEPLRSEDGRWRIRTDDDEDEVADVVVNALWNGRLPVDVTAGVDPDPPWTHRYRLCVFARTRTPHRVPSALVAVGPFGDVKNYTDRDFYLSWYPAGLLAQGGALELPQPELPTGDEATAFVERVRSALGVLVPGIDEVLDDAEETVVHGGFVFAQGQGALDDPRSGLHRRDRYGVRRRGSYHSVDTGKYSTAPWSARILAEEIAG
ncbi:NAD(P)/FAD-dependent oxidoreductase [Agromyces binzhouensis]|uniref:NAD(P)/FAD-dependent oxidoreductase n=1 Tax=Agromyces binzhouensis TaxID=1817495 RepID=UPI00362FFCA1